MKTTQLLQPITQDPCLDANGGITLRPYDGSEHGDTSAEPIATVYIGYYAPLLAAAPELLAKLQRLLGVCELNQDDMEPETREAVQAASTLCAEFE